MEKVLKNTPTLLAGKYSPYTFMRDWYWNMIEELLNEIETINLFWLSIYVLNGLGRFFVSSMGLMAWCHYNDVIMGSMASQITSLAIVSSPVYLGADQRKQFRVTGLCGGNSSGLVNSPHKGPVTRKMFPFDDVIMTRAAGHQCPLCLY